MRQRERSKQARRKWQELLSEQGRSGEWVAAFCRERQLCASHFYWWKKRLGASGAEKFVEVKLAAAASTPGAEESTWSDLFKYQALVEIDPATSRLEELPLLVSLGWYLMILHHEDASSAGAVVATMG